MKSNNIINPITTITIGSRGDTVKELQRCLNTYWSSIIKQKLVEDGICGQRTLQACMLVKTTCLLSSNPSINDLEYKIICHPFSSTISYQSLSTSEYKNETSIKRGLVLHHTVSGPSPQAVRNYWNRQAGDIGTHFIIGGNGEVLQCVPLNCWVHHLGLTHPQNSLFNASAIGVEVCSWGALDKVGNKFYSKYEQPTLIDSNNVVDLGYKYRGNQYFHLYTEESCNSLIKLSKYIKDIFGFDYSNTDLNTFFEYQLNNYVRKYPVLSTHTGWRLDKSDLCPQPRMLDTVKEIIKSI